MNRFRTQVLTLLLAALTGGGMVRAAEPSADEILRAIRMNPAEQEIRLKGQIRPERGKKVPFRLIVEDGVIKYQFDDPSQEIDLVLGEDDSELRERTGGGGGEVKPARNEERVRGTAITYEDLAMRVLYRPRSKVLGSDNIKTRDCWKIEVQGGRDNSAYAAARLWIDKEGGALMRMEGYGADGRILKRFEVVSGQKIDGQWMLKSMRVESYDPQTHKVTARTYLEILGKDQ